VVILPQRQRSIIGSSEAAPHITGELPTPVEYEKRRLHDAVMTSSQHRETPDECSRITTPSYETLNGIPPIDVAANVQAALARGRRATGIAAETAVLRFGPGKLTPQEYFYYWLWDGRMPLGDKKAFVGKMAQHPMHVATGSRVWFATSADKILFHSIMTAARRRIPETLAITHARRHLPDVPTIADADNLARFRRDPSLYPLFAKQVAGKYSLSVVSTDSYDASSDEVILLGGGRRRVGDLAASLVGGAGYLIQRRLSPAPALAKRFGPRLWSVRLLVFVTADGPVTHRAAAKIATGTNAADNYWRADNRLGAIDLATGQITALVGTGLDLKPTFREALILALAVYPQARVDLDATGAVWEEYWAEHLTATAIAP
jgi:hypothetical protein